MPFSPMKRALGLRFSRDADMATTLEDEHKIIEGVLAQLEAMADALPALPPVSALESVVLHLRESIPAHCRHEEQVLAERIADASGMTDHDLHVSRQALALLREEHIANEAIAHELADALEDCIAAGETLAAESLGQLARQFFMLIRRHMAWEEFVLDILAQPQGT